MFMLSSNRGSTILIVMVILGLLLGALSLSTQQFALRGRQQKVDRISSARGEVESLLRSNGVLASAIRQSILYEKSAVGGLDFTALGTAPTQHLVDCVEAIAPGTCADGASFPFSLIGPVGDSAGAAQLLGRGWVGGPGADPALNAVGAYFNAGASPCASAAFAPALCPIEVFVAFTGDCGGQASPCPRYSNISVSYFIRQRHYDAGGGTFAPIPLDTTGSTLTLAEKKDTLPAVTACQILDPANTACTPP